MSRAVEDMESTRWNHINDKFYDWPAWILPVAGTGEGDDAVDEGREEGAVAMLKEERAARSAWTGAEF